MKAQKTMGRESKNYKEKHILPSVNRRTDTSTKHKPPSVLEPMSSGMDTASQCLPADPWGESDPYGRSSLALMWLVMKDIMDVGTGPLNKPPPVNMASYREKRRQQI